MRLMHLAAVAALALPACRSHQADFTIVSNRNVNYDQILSARQYQNPAEREGFSNRHWLFCLLPVGRPTLEDAVEDALRQANADCMVDVTAWSYWWAVPPFYARSGWVVQGRAVNTYLPTPNR